LAKFPRITAEEAEKLGEAMAERFIALLQRDKFDYTKWRKDL